MTTDDSISIEAKYFAYIYRDPKTLKVRYAGYGTRPGRAFSVGHNEKVAKVVEDGEGFEILIAGPYRDEEEARNVEAALVSASSLDLNLIQQRTGKSFPQEPFAQLLGAIGAVFGSWMNERALMATFNSSFLLYSRSSEMMLF